MGAIDNFLNNYILGDAVKEKTGIFALKEKTPAQFKEEKRIDDIYTKREIASDIQGGGLKNLIPMLANYTVAEPLAFIGSVFPGETMTNKNLLKKLKTPLQYDNEVVKRIFNVDLDSLEGEEKEAAINQIDSFIRKNSNVSGLAEAASYLVGGGFGTKAGTKVGATARKLKDPTYADELTPNIFKPNNNLPLTSAGAKAVDKTPAVLTKLKEAQAGTSKFAVAEITKSKEFIDFAKDKFKQMTVDGVPPLKKAWGKEIGITADSSINRLLKKPEFKDLPFLSNEEVYTKTFLNPEFRAASNESMAVTNYNKALVRANETGGPVIYQPGKQRQILFPENNVAIKEKFLLDLEKATKGKKGGDRKFTLNDMARKYNMGEGDFNQAIKNFKKEEGLLNDPKYNFEAPTFTGKGSTSERNKAISEWINNSNTKQVDKDIYKEAKTLVSNHNSSNPDNKMNLDHIMGFINSKNKIDAQTVDNLQITTEIFNKQIKAVLFEKPGSGFRSIDKAIKNTKDKVVKQNLIKVREDLFNDYVKTVQNAGYFMDNTGLPFLPKKMQINTKTKNGLRQQIDSLQNQLDSQIDSLLAEQTGYQSNFGYKKGGRVKAKNGIFTGDNIYTGVSSGFEGIRAVQENIKKLYEDSELKDTIEPIQEQVEIKVKDVLEETRKVITKAGRPVEVRPLSEGYKLLTENPILRRTLAAPTVLYGGAISAVGETYNALRKGTENDIDLLNDYFPAVVKLNDFLINKNIEKTPDEQTYISFIDEINRAQDAGINKAAFNIVDLIATGYDAGTGFNTDFAGKVKSLYDKAIEDGSIQEPETFLGKIGSIGVEFGVPIGTVTSFTNRLRRGIKSSFGLNLFALPTYGLKGSALYGRKIANVSKRVGTGAVIFGGADTIAGGPYNTVSQEFADDPLLFDESLGYDYEDTEGLSGKELTVTNFKNRLRFGADGAMIGGLFPLIGPPLWMLTKYGAIKPGAAALGVATKTVDTLAIKPISYLAANIPGVKQVGQVTAQGVSLGASFLGKDILTRATVAAMGSPTLKQIPDFKDWRMFEVNAEDPLKRNLKKVDNVLKIFREAGPKTNNQVYLDSKTQQFIKGKSREIEKYLDAIEVKAYDLANGFLNRYNTAKTSPAGENYLLEQVLAYTKGQIKLKDLPKELQSLSKALGESFDEVKNLYKEVLPDGVGLKDYLNTNLKDYIRQSFAAFTNPQFRPSADVKEKAINFVSDTIRKDSYLTDLAQKTSNQLPEQAIRNFARQQVNDILATAKTEGLDPIIQLQNIAKNNLKLDDLTIQTGEELPEVIRKLLGEEKSLRSSVMQTTSSLVTQAANLKNNDRLAKLLMQEGRLFTTRDEAIAAGIVNPVSVGKVPNLGLLDSDISQLFGSRELTAMLRGSSGQLDKLMESSIWQGMVAYKALVQTGKTVLSPATQTRNFGSAAAFPLNNGWIGGSASVTDAFKITLDDIFGAGRTVDEVQLIKNISRKTELGVIDENIVASELSAVLADIKSGKISTFGKLTSVADNSKLMKTATRLYAGGDNVWKWYGHEYLMSQLKGAFKSMDELKATVKNDFNITEFNPKNMTEGIEEYAALLVRELMPTYSKVPPLIQAIRKIPFIGNFVSFPAEILRTSLATSSLAMKHIASNNPTLRAMGYRSLMGQSATLYALNEGVRGIGYLMTNVTEDQVQTYKNNFAPDYMRYSDLVPLTSLDKKTGTFKVFDLSRYNPYDLISSTVNNLIIRATNPQPKLDPKKIQTDVFKEYINASGPLFDLINGTLFGFSIGAEGIAEVVSNKKKSGGPVYSESDLDVEKFDKSLMHLFNKDEPGIVSTAQRIYGALAGDVSGTGQAVSLSDEAFKLIGGSTVTVDVPGSFAYKISDYQNTFREPKVTEGWYSTKNYQNRGPAQLVREYDQMNEEALRQQYEFYKAVKSALNSKLMTRTQVVLALKNRNISQSTIGAILNGRYKPLSYGKGGLEARYEKIKKANPDKRFNRNDFLPIGALERTKANWSRIQFKDLELEQNTRTEPQETSQAPTIPQNRTAIAEPQVPPLPDTGTPVVSSQQTASVAGNTVSPRTGLTDSESVLLSPTDQLYRRKQRGLA